MKQTLDVVAVIMNQCTVGDHGMIMLSYGNGHNQPIMTKTYLWASYEEEKSIYIH